ncbi:MAG: hypothetical protein V2J42_14115 [Wenzhouxiangella sp.]|jgi:hypothetical protein|nr:hypothetical protein [Wenzhouxiangella sp.]
MIIMPTGLSQAEFNQWMDGVMDAYLGSARPVNQSEAYLRGYDQQRDHEGENHADKR